MNLGLEGRAALVTGGASGIGAATAVALAREGCDVTWVDCVTGGPRAEIEALGRRARAVIADVRDHARAVAVAEEARAAFGRLDLLVCCAGITADAPTWRMTEAQWDDVLAVNLKGAWNFCKAAARPLMKVKGRIVNVTSVVGLTGNAGQANYAASKAGVIGLTKSLAKELAGVAELYHKNLVSISRYTQLQRDQTRLQGERGQFIAEIARARGKISETELQIIQLDQDFRTEVLKDLRDAQGKIAELKERVTAAEDQLKRVDLRAPQAGFVHQLAVHTVGGVIGNGEVLMEIVPRADELVVEAKVAPPDIDQVAGSGELASLKHRDEHG